MLNEVLHLTLQYCCSHYIVIPGGNLFAQNKYEECFTNHITC